MILVILMKLWVEWSEGNAKDEKVEKEYFKMGNDLKIR